MKFSRQLCLSFKGERLYIHGSDTFNEITRAFEEISAGYISKLSFKRMTHKQLELIVTKQPLSRNTVALGKWITRHGETSTFLVNETAKNVSGRYSFNEDLIVANSHLLDKSMISSGNHTYSPIENIIALTKRLNYSVNPDIDGKWLFGEISLDAALPLGWSEIHISSISTLVNRFSRSSVRIDGSLFGNISFVVGKP